jgi:hypothetical protein
MVEQPSMSYESDGSHVVWDLRSARSQSPVRFMGWLLLIVGSLLLLYDVRRWSFREPLEMLLPLFTLALGALLVSVNRHAPPKRLPLLRFWAGEGALVARVEQFADGDYREISLHDLTHVVFGMIDYPWPGREGVEVEAFALYLARDDGTPVPVIDGTMDKMASYHIARALSDVLGLPLIEMGKGQRP